MESLGLHGQALRSLVSCHSIYPRFARIFDKSHTNTSPLLADCAEILPYNIRAKGVAINLALTALSSVLNQYVNPIGLERLEWKFYFVYIVILVIECLCIWFLFVVSFQNVATTCKFNLLHRKRKDPPLSRSLFCSMASLPTWHEGTW